jgi:hypothetical protein
MLSVEPFRYGDDNLGYVIYGAEQAMAVDGGAWEEILAFLHGSSLSLSYVTNTPTISTTPRETIPFSGARRPLFYPLRIFRTAGRFCWMGER